MHYILGTVVRRLRSLIVVRWRHSRLGLVILIRARLRTAYLRRRFMRFATFVCMVLLALGQNSTSQSAPDLREAMYQRYLQLSSLIKGGVVDPHWMDDGDSFWFVD